MRIGKRSTDVGGIGGYASGASLSYSYNSGLVSGTTNVGGLVGFGAGSGSMTYNYWDKTINSSITSMGNIPNEAFFLAFVCSTCVSYTTGQMMTQAKYTGWDLPHW